MDKINIFMYCAISWITSFCLSLIMTTMMCAIFLLLVPFILVIFPFILAGRLQMDVLNLSGNEVLQKLQRQLFWGRSKDAYPLRRIWRWKFHFNDDFNCWITATNVHGKFVVEYEGTKNDEVERMVENLKQLNKKKLFWEVRKLEKEGKGILAIIYKREK